VNRETPPRSRKLLARAFSGLRCSILLYGEGCETSSVMLYLS
jgi:hypothetical protein